jgi:hypothetical protein
LARNVVLFASSLILVGLACLAANAADEKKPAEKPAAGKKDPVDSAFATPKGVTLRSDQQEAMKKLREKWEQKLRDAMAAVERAGSEEEKSKAARDVMKDREDIKKEIQAILNTPAPAPTPQNNNQNNQRRHRRR